MDEYNPYKNMTLQQELEARFAEVDRKQKEQDALDYIRNNMQFSPNNAGNINTDQQPNGWSSLSNSNSGFDSSTVSQYLNNATNQLINVRKNNDNSLNFAENASNLYNDMRQEYLEPRNYQNRYKQGCIPSNVAYNTISNYQISSNPKLIENGNIVSNFSMQKVLSKIPIAGKYINRIAIGEKIGNGLASFYNALDEADCLK